MSENNEDDVDDDLEEEVIDPLEGMEYENLSELDQAEVDRQVTIEAFEEVTAELSRPFPDMQLVPAGMFFPNYGGFGIYVKWKGNGTRDTINIKSASSWTVHFDAPDREVFIVGNLHIAESSVSMGGWDEFTPLSIFHEPNLSVDGCGPSTFMVNAHQSKSGSVRSHNTRRDNNYAATKTIIGDSGGYQLKKKSNFIDPRTVADYYNHNVDIGMVLDFPLFDPSHSANLKKTVEIQRRNIEIMMSSLDARVKVCNIAHGSDYNTRLDFLEEVHHDSIRAVAISKSTQSENIITFIHNFINFTRGLEKRWPGHYKHVHILGMSDNRSYIPLMRAMADGLMPNIKVTMDSTTAIQLATTKGYVQHRHSTENYSVLKFGTDGNFMSPMQRLPCSCPVCRAVGWMDGMTALTSNSVTMFLLMYHNMFAMDAYFRNMLWYCTRLSNDDLNLMVNQVFTKKDVRADVVQALNYVRDYATLNDKKRAVKYKFFLKSEKHNKNNRMTGHAFDLFDGISVVGDESELETLGYNEIFNDGSIENQKPLAEIDEDRIATYLDRLAALKTRSNAELENNKNTSGKASPKQKRVRKRVRLDEAGNEVVTYEEKRVKSKKVNKKKIELAKRNAEDDIKILHSTKSTSAPSLKKQKQAARNKITKKETTKVMGRTIKKSKNHKRL